jgi:hypothetical protein
LSALPIEVYFPKAELTKTLDWWIGNMQKIGALKKEKRNFATHIDERPPE